MPHLGNFIFKDVCDLCGCAGYGQAGRGWAGRGASNSNSGGQRIEWETVASTTITGNGSFDFGARGAGIWKITAEKLAGHSEHAYPEWNAGGVTMDNGDGLISYQQPNSPDKNLFRDRSYALQFHFSAFFPYRNWRNPTASPGSWRYHVLKNIGANGHFPNGDKAAKWETWGHGYNGRWRTGSNPTYGGLGWLDTVWDNRMIDDNEKRNGAIFIWMSDVTMIATPTLTAASTPVRAGYYSTMRFNEGWRRNFLPHTAGGSISGSISGIPSANPDPITGPFSAPFAPYYPHNTAPYKVKIRLHKLAPVVSYLWLRNMYPKPMAAVRFTRWTGHRDQPYVATGGTSYTQNAVFPIWSYDAYLDREAPANMSRNCHYNLFKAPLDAPFSWKPEYFAGWHHGYTPAHQYKHQGSFMLSHMVDSRRADPAYGIGGRDEINWEGRWSSFTVQPIFTDGTFGETRKTSITGGCGVGYGTGACWGSGFSLPALPASGGSRATASFAHQSTIGGLPHCYGLPDFDPNSSYNLKSTAPLIN